MSSQSKLHYIECAASHKPADFIYSLSICNSNYVCLSTMNECTIMRSSNDIVWCDDNNEYEMYNNVNPQTFFLFVWFGMRTRNCRFRGYCVELIQLIDEDAIKTIIIDWRFLCGNLNLLKTQTALKIHICTSTFVVSNILYPNGFLFSQSAQFLVSFLYIKKNYVDNI